MVSSIEKRLRLALKIRLRTVTLLIAALALALTLLVPWIKRVWFPGAWNTWIVRTVTREDGSVVRMRIRRHPERDEVFEEVLSQPARGSSSDRAKTQAQSKR